MSTIFFKTFNYCFLFITLIVLTADIFAEESAFVYEYIAPRSSAGTIALVTTQEKQGLKVDGMRVSFDIPFVHFNISERYLMNERTLDKKRVFSGDIKMRAPVFLPYEWIPVAGLGISELEYYADFDRIGSTKFGLYGALGTYKKLNESIYFSVLASNYVFDTETVIVVEYQFVSKEFRSSTTFVQARLGYTAFHHNGHDFSAPSAGVSVGF